MKTTTKAADIQRRIKGLVAKSKAMVKMPPNEKKLTQVAAHLEECLTLMLMIHEENVASSA